MLFGTRIHVERFALELVQNWQLLPPFRPVISPCPVADDVDDEVDDDGAAVVVKQHAARAAKLVRPTDGRPAHQIVAHA